MTEPAEPVDQQQPEPLEDPDTEPDTWVLIAIAYDRRRVEWTLWAFGRDRSAGRVEANEAVWFSGEFGQAGRIFDAFVNN